MGSPRILLISPPLTQLNTPYPSTAYLTGFLRSRGIACEHVYKVNEGRPNVVDHIKNGKIQLMLNTPRGKKAKYDERAMRLAGAACAVPAGIVLGLQLAT